MDRRSFIKTAAAGGMGVATTSLASPAIAAEAPEIKWRVTSSFPKSLDTIYGGATDFADRVRAATDGKFDIQVFAAGELAAGLQAADAVMNGSVEGCHTAPYYYIGKDPTWAFGGALPFGMNTRILNAWWYQGGGDALVNEFYAAQGLVGLNCGNTGAQMGGWYRNEIKSLSDMKDLKFRIGGLGGRVLERLGVIPQQVAGGDIYPSLEKGTIDGAEWIGPYDDQKLGFHQVAPYYYTPGFWEGSLMLHLLFAKDKWDALPETYKAIATAAATEANTQMLAKYDAKNPAALRALIAEGAKVTKYPDDVLNAAYDAAMTLYDEISAENAAFKKIYDHYKPFMDDGYFWYSIADTPFDLFILKKRK